MRSLPFSPLARRFQLLLLLFGGLYRRDVDAHVDSAGVAVIVSDFEAAPGVVLVVHYEELEDPAGLLGMKDANNALSKRVCYLAIAFELTTRYFELNLFVYDYLPTAIGRERTELTLL